MKSAATTNLDVFDLNPNCIYKIPALIEFGVWHYRLTVTVDVTVGARWSNWLDQALSAVYHSLPLSDFNDPPQIVLLRADGETLICSDDDEECEDWLFSMLVTARLDLTRAQEVAS